MPDNPVIWEDDALKLLEERDRYTRTAIRDEFRQDPRKGAISLDVSTTRSEADRDRLKEYVQRAVSIESKGEIRIT